MSRCVRLLGLEKELSVRICAGDVTRGKPHPEPVLKALDALHALPEDAYFVGDSEHDIEAGREAGVDTVAVSWGPFPREKLEAARRCLLTHISALRELLAGTRLVRAAPVSETS